ncbi:MAG: DUF2339 domain-containing protein [Acidobacteriota bacterium]
MPEDNKDRLDELIERVEYLERALREHLTRFYALERRLGLTYYPPSPPAEPVRRPAVEPRRESKPAVESPNIVEPPPRIEPKIETGVKPPSTPAPVYPPRPAAPVFQPPPAREYVSQAYAAPKSEDASAWRDLESRIGGRWLLWIGIIAISLGMAFFLRLAFNEWIGQRGRVAVGVIIGLGFLAGAERLRSRYPVYAYGLSGGGILILYLSGFAAYSMYQLVAQPVAFVYMVAVTAAASLLAARYSALPIALLGLIGGFLTPVLLSTNVDNQVGLFGYIALLDLGVLALAYSKQWRVLNYLAFICTTLMFVGWWNKFYEPEKLWTTIFFLTLFFVIFALLAVLYNVINRQPTRWLDLILVFLNGAIYFGASYSLLDDNYRSYLGLFAVLVSVFYLALGYFTYRRDPDDRLLLYTFLGLAFLFLVLAVPIQFDQHWVTMGWAIEGMVMTWIGLKTDDRTSRYAAMGLFAVALSHWLWIDVNEFAYRAGESFAPLINRRALSCAVMILSLAVSAWLYKKSDAETEEDERSVFWSLQQIGAEERGMFRAVYTLGANALAVALLSLDANSYFEQRKAAGQNLGALDNAKHLTFSALWAVYGAMALTAGITRRMKVLRVAALGLMAAATIKVLLIDLQYYKAAWHTTVFNQTFAAFAVLIVSLAAAAWFYARSEDIDPEEKSLAFPALVVAANVLAVIALSAEAIGHFERVKSPLIDQGVFADIMKIENTKQMALSWVWTLYASAALVLGLFRRSKPVRMGALVLLALAALKVMTIDLRFAGELWHRAVLNQTFGAFALIVAAMALGAWLYSRAKGIEEREYAIVASTLVCAANLLALVAMSAEVFYYFERMAAALAQTETVTRAMMIENAKHFYLSLLWSVYAAAAIVAGIARNQMALRAGAIGLLAIATAKVLLIDLSFSTEPWHTPVLNQTLGAFASLIAAMICAVWFYSRAKRIDERERKAVIIAMTVVGNILAIIALSAEANGYFEARMRAIIDSGGDVSDLQLARQLSLSLVWAIYGGGMLTVGIARRNRLLRVMALFLIGITIVKVFILDLASLERIYRVISLIALGVILLGGAFLYQRLRRLTMDEEAAESASTNTKGSAP